MKIVTDSAADMPAEELQELNVSQAPLYIQFPQGEVSSNDLTIDDFYQRLEGMKPAIPTTSQPSSGYFLDLYRRLADTGEEILSIHISSGLSGTLNAARSAARQLAGSVKVTVWDTLTLSGGQRFQVLAAALATRAGWAKQAILDRLEQIRASTEVVYTLDTLDYLVHGGRVGRVQALASSLLQIKPIIHVDRRDGKYSTVTKSRTLSRALAAITAHLETTYGNTPLWVTVLHGDFAAQASALASQLGESLEVLRSETMRISPVLGVHTGPGIVGAAVMPMNLLADLVGGAQ